VTFEEFINDDHLMLRSSYVSIKCNGIWLELYMRKALRPRGAFEIGNVRTRNERQRGKGAFTAFLNEWENKLPLMVELAHNPRLAAYLERRGWTFVDRPGYFFHHNTLYGELLA
jgi:hypothetical protein